MQRFKPQPQNEQSCALPTEQTEQTDRINYDEMDGIKGRTKDEIT